MVSKLKKKLLVFDLDGTIIDSLDDVTECFNYALVKFDFSSVTRNDILNLMGHNLDEILNILTGYSADKSLILDIRNEYLKRYKDSKNLKTIVYPGLKELFNKLHYFGYIISINTNKEQKLAELIINNKLCFQFPVFIVGYTKELNSKPSPDGVLKIMNQFNFKKEDILYIGDGYSDYLTARNSQVDFLHVTWGYNTEIQRFCDLPEYRYVETTKELESFLLGENKC